MIELLLGPFDLDRSVSRRLDVVLGAFRPGEIPLRERSVRLATALGIDKLDAMIIVLTIDEVVDPCVFPRVKYGNTELLSFYKGCAEQDIDMDVECIIGITRSGCAFGCGGNLFPVDDSQEALENFDARVRASTRGDQVRESSYHFCSWSIRVAIIAFPLLLTPGNSFVCPGLDAWNANVLYEKGGLHLLRIFSSLPRMRRRAPLRSRYEIRRRWQGPQLSCL